LLSHLNSNGSKVTREMAKGLIDAGLSSLKWSFQGADRKTYAESRNTDFYDGLLEVAAMVKDIRGNRPLPYLHISTSITSETPEIVAAFRERASQVVDLVTVGHTTFDYLDLRAARLSATELETLKRLMVLSTDEKKHPSPCPEVYDKITIHSDGSARVCCNDVNGETNLGNVATSSIAKMWRHPEMEDYRKRLAGNDYGGPLCSSCYDYADLTEGTA
jgi:MoaA/NifB/PqqE/SkfB family radical SAM enzyme